MAGWVECAAEPPCTRGLSGARYVWQALGTTGFACRRGDLHSWHHNGGVLYWTEARLGSLCPSHECEAMQARVLAAPPPVQVSLGGGVGPTPEQLALAAQFKAQEAAGL